jgi:hypothetical protein
MTGPQEVEAAATFQAITGPARYQNATTITTGVPEIEKEIGDYLQGELRTHDRRSVSHVTAQAPFRPFAVRSEGTRR